MSAPDEPLRVERDGPVLRVTLNRADQLNALNEPLIDALRTLFSDLYWQTDIRVVVLAGAGRAFCAGLDLKMKRAIEPSARTVTQALVSQRKISEIVMAMRRCPQPIVALVDGAASGGGLGLALASDIRVATPRTRMNAAFIKLGLSGCDIGVSYFLMRMIGMSAATELLLTGRFLEVERAQTLGLVSRIVAPEEIAAVGEQLVADMLRASPAGLRLTKDALNHIIDIGGLEAAIALEDRNQSLCSRDPDFEEGIAAFREKRAPRYRSA